jgi:hypothetical protein
MVTTMNFYEMTAARIGTAEARALAERLNTWHDEMVMHRRRALRNPSSEPCSADCPYYSAVYFWSEARRILGECANELRFLRSAATVGPRGHARGRDRQPIAGSA